MTDMTAEERERATWILKRLGGEGFIPPEQHVHFVAKQIRQAEAAARKTALEYVYGGLDAKARETAVNNGLHALAESEEP